MSSIDIKADLRSEKLPVKSIRIAPENRKECGDGLKLVHASYRSELGTCRMEYSFKDMMKIVAKYYYKEKAIEINAENPKHPVMRADYNYDHTMASHLFSINVDQFLLFPNDIAEYLENLQTLGNIEKVLEQCAELIYEFAKDPEKFSKKFI